MGKSLRFVNVRGLCKGSGQRDGYIFQGQGPMRRAWREAESLVEEMLRNQWYGGKDHLMNSCG